LLGVLSLVAVAVSFFDFSRNNIKNTTRVACLDLTIGAGKMASQTTLSFWQLFFVALGPASLTAAVAFLVPLVTEARREGIEKRKRKIEKLEQLIEKIYEYHHWTGLFFQKYGLQKDVEPGQSPVLHAKAIILIHFPQLKKEMDDLFVKSKEYELWCLELGKKNLKKDQVDIETSRPLYKSYIDAEETLLLAAIKLGREELKL
jgi:hypothetical protein